MAVLGAAAAGALPQIWITGSQTWVPLQDGTICIHLIGGGGSGGSNDYSGITGGGAGGYVKIPSFAVTTAGSFTLVVGAGGPGAKNGSSNNGGSSSISGTGMSATFTASGGFRGQYGATNGSGGGYNGPAGYGYIGRSGGGGSRGGGAVGIYGTGQSATGGSSTAGGLGAASDAQGGGLSSSGYGQICGGTHAGRFQTRHAQTGEYDGTTTQDGEDLCGGGWIYFNQTARLCMGGNGGIGGGGGGCAVTQNANYAWGGSGGDGIILIQYLPE